MKPIESRIGVGAMTMRAVVCTRYGPPDVLQLREIEKPSPKRDEVLIKMRATAVTSSDCIVRGFRIRGPMAIPARLIMGVTKPRHSVIGLVVAGEVEAVGKRVSSFKPGDEVFGFEGFAFGAYAEYKRMRAGGILALKPSNQSYEEAAAITYGGMLALHFLKKGNIGTGQRVLVYGASGAAGTSAVQLAKHFGAVVTGVCGPTNIDLVRSLGADAVIDYKEHDFTKMGERYDLIFIAVGNRVHPPTRADCQMVLAPGGSYVSVDQELWDARADELLLIKQLAEAGVLKPVIDRTYRLDQMAEAHAYVDEGHKKGNVVITVS
jgi:NADPH:quinone reductase-like Zn-dependent oxidoreductase